MTKKEKNFILACVLGDGCINKRIINNTIQCRYLMRHSNTQFDYFKWKVDRLISIFDKSQNKQFKIKSNWSYENNSGKSKILSVRFERNHPYLKSLYNFIYQNGKKTFSKKVLNRLDLEGIAVWYMDDGSLYNVKYKTSKNTYKYRTAQCTLNTYLSEKENEIIVKWFKNNYDINWRIVKDKSFTRLQMGTKEARKFFALIKDFIHPSMMYKIDIKVGQEIKCNTLHPVMDEDIVH